MKNISEKLDTAASIRNRCARIAIPSCIIGTFIDGISDLLDSEILNYFVWIPMVIGLLSMIRIFNFWHYVFDFQISFRKSWCFQNQK